MNEAQTEAIANANAHLNNAALPSVDTLVASLDDMLALYELMKPLCADRVDFTHDLRASNAAMLLRDLVA